MKSGYYDPTKRQESILNALVSNPLIISDDPLEQARDSANMATCIALMVAAHKMVIMASEFSDESNESEISTVEKSIEDIIECYSETV